MFCVKKVDNGSVTGCALYSYTIKAAIEDKLEPVELEPSVPQLKLLTRGASGYSSLFCHCVCHSFIHCVT